MFISFPNMAVVFASDCRKRKTTVIPPQKQNSYVHCTQSQNKNKFDMTDIYTQKQLDLYLIQYLEKYQYSIPYLIPLGKTATILTA